MVTVNAQEAAADLSALLKKVEHGETVIISIDDRPVAELRPASSTNNLPRPFGLCAGEFVVPDDFDAPLPADILADFERA